MNYRCVMNENSIRSSSDSEPQSADQASLFHARRGTILWPVAAMIAAVCLIPWAEQLLTFVNRLADFRPVASLFEAAEQIGSGTVTLGIIALVWLLDRRRRKLLVYYVVALLLAGNINRVIKETAGRARPEYGVALKESKVKTVLKDLGQDVAVQSAGTNLRNDRWLWFGTNRQYFKDRYASFPSGHACTAFVSAAFLCLLYPKGRKVWLIAAGAAALARVYSKRHYFEDALFGAALGWLTVHWVFMWHWPLQAGKSVEAFVVRRFRAEQALL